MATIQMLGYRCERCDHKWAPREDALPRVCPRCKSPYWNTARKRQLKAKIGRKP